MSNCKDISLKAEFLKSSQINASNPEALTTTNICEDLRVLIKNFASLCHHCHLIISIGWSQDFVNRSEIVEIQHCNPIDISCIEDVLNVLQFLCLQLIGSVNNELSKVIEYYSLLIWLEVQILILLLSSDDGLLLLDYFETILE